MNVVPTLDQLAADPARAQGLPRAALLDLAVRALQAHAAVTTALISVGPDAAPADREDSLLSARQLAQRMGVNVQYVYEHASEWPFRLEIRPLRFSLRGFESWVAEGGRTAVGSRRASAPRGA